MLHARETGQPSEWTLIHIIISRGFDAFKKQSAGACKRSPILPAMASAVRALRGAPCRETQFFCDRCMGRSSHRCHVETLEGSSGLGCNALSCVLASEKNKQEAYPNEITGVIRSDPPSGCGWLENQAGGMLLLRTVRYHPRRSKFRRIARPWRYMWAQSIFTIRTNVSTTT